MNDTQGTSAPPKAEQPVSNPASDRAINLLGWACLVVAILLFYVLIASWPVVDPAQNAKRFLPAYLFTLEADWLPDRRMLFTVVIAGAIGSLAHALTSFADFVGNKRFSANWIWWYALRLPIGVAIALFFYLIIRGGLLVPTGQSPTSDTQGTTLSLNPYSIAAFAALAGLFSRHATDKLSEVFEAVLSRRTPVKRDDPLIGLATLTFEPPKLTKDKPEALTVTGKGFLQGCTASIAGQARDVQWLSATQIKVTTLAADVAKAGKFELVIRNPNNGDSFKGLVEVV
jgi:hypothetical protein